MAWVITGECNRCGICCKPPVVIENPCMVRGDDRCLFLTYRTVDSKQLGHCLIIGRPGVIEKVKDRHGVLINAEQLRWHEYNCPVWPDRPKDIEQLKAGLFELLSECGFVFEEREGITTKPPGIYTSITG